MNSRPIVVTAAEGETGGHTMAKQNRLLVTKTVRLNEEGLNIRYAELGDGRTRRCCYCMAFPESARLVRCGARFWPSGTTYLHSIGLVLAGATR